MPPDEPNQEERLEELPEDGDTPFRPASTSGDDTQPDTDTDIDVQELYDAGESTAASGPDEPHDDPTVLGYTPPDSP